MLDESRTEESSDEWETPQAFFDLLNKEFHFTLDAAASDENHKCDKYYTINTNGLIHSWKGETVWINPPYGRQYPNWVKKAYQESEDNEVKSVLLIPARPDSRIWHDYIFPRAYEIRFIRGRLQFSNYNNSAKYPSAVIVFWNRENDDRIIWYKRSINEIINMPKLNNDIPRLKPVEHGWF